MEIFRAVRRIDLAREAGRKNKAWGEARFVRNPRFQASKISSPRSGRQKLRDSILAVTRLRGFGA